MKIFLAMLRESRGSRGRLFFFMLCLAVGVAAVVGVAALSNGIKDGLRAKGREILAADVMVESRRPLPDGIEKIAVDAGAVETAAVREFATMIASVDANGETGPSHRAMVKSVQGRFPFYGPLVLDPPGTLEDALTRGVVVAPELLAGAGVEVGGRIRLGGKSLPVVAVVTREPQQIGFASMLGPRVFVSEKHLADSRLLGFGSRVKYQLLARLPQADAASVHALAKRLKTEPEGAEYLSVETWRAGQPRIRSAVRRVERFLALVALLSLVLGGIGVAQIIGAWVESRTPAIAILRCLGMRPREIMTMFLGQVGVLAIVGSAVGALIGTLLPLAFAGLAEEFIGPDVIGASVFQWTAMGRGMVLGTGIALLFSLPPLTAVWRVSPAKVLRAEAEPLPAPAGMRWGARGVLLFGLFGAAWAQSRSVLLSAAFTAGFLALAGLLAGSAWLVMRGVARLPRERLHPYVVQGLTALARPGAGTTGGIVALGLGVMVVANMIIVESELSSGIRTLIPKDAPTVFLVDVQPDQWEGVHEELVTEGADPIQSAALVMARIRAINGESVAAINKRRGGSRGSRWSLTREQRISTMETLPESNRIIAGELWSEPNVPEVSIEDRYARSLGVKLGDWITFDLLGLPLKLKVTSLRKVEWRSFGINFFVGVEPGILTGVPSLRLAAARMDEASEQPLQDRLAARFPNVTMIRIRPILDQVVTLLEKLAWGVRGLGAFTVLAGLAILAGAISATTLRRRREAALLKTLGATRRGVVTLLLIEYGLLGAVAGLLGSIGAVLLAWGFLEGLADLEFALPLWAVPLSTVLSACLAAACGILASLKAINAMPIESIRE